MSTIYAVKVERLKGFTRKYETRLKRLARYKNTLAYLSGLSSTKKDSLNHRLQHDAVCRRRRAHVGGRLCRRNSGGVGGRNDDDRRQRHAQGRAIPGKVNCDLQNILLKLTVENLKVVRAKFSAALG